MPRALPDSVTKEEVERMEQVRRDIWIDGMYGFALGAVGALLAHSGVSVVGRYRKLPFVLNRNTALAWSLGGGALGSLLFSTTRGKNDAHKLYGIVKHGSKDDNEEESVAHQIKRVEEELQERERNRLYRRETLQNALNKGTGGLSDAHGGHWIDEKDNKS